MKSYSSDLIDRVVSHYQTTQDSLRKTGQIFQVSKTSIWRWLKDERPNKKHQAKHYKISHLKQWVTETILERPHSRLKDLSQMIWERFRIQISQSSLSRFLSREKISWKKMRREINRPSNTDQLKKYFKVKMRVKGYDQVLSFDEVGF